MISLAREDMNLGRNEVCVEGGGRERGVCVCVCGGGGCRKREEKVEGPHADLGTA